MPTPSELKRRILLAVSGLSPQILTETIYALSRGADPFIPTEVHLITTREGADRARKSLLREGRFAQLCADYGLDGIKFGEAYIHCVLDRAGAAIQDIRTSADNEFVADTLINHVRNFTADSGSALHVSIAGGRKTMSFFAGNALTLFGRPQDRLSHVLVEEGYEFARDFFYPTPKQRMIQGHNGSMLDAARANVLLAEIPFVSLRHELPESLKTGVTRYSEVVRLAQAALAPPELVIDLRSRRIRAAGKIVRLSPNSIAMLSIFARRALKNDPAIHAPAKPVQDFVLPDKDWGKRLLDELLEVYDHRDDIPEETRKALREGMDGNQFSTYLARLNKSLKNSLGAAAMAYLIGNAGRRPCLYRINLSREAIRYGNVPPE